MKITSLVKSIILSGNEKQIQGREALRVGDRLIGKVLHVKGGGKAFFDFGRFRALAETGFPVRQGETIQVEVVDKGVPLRLRLCHLKADGLDAQKGSVPRGEFPSPQLLKEFQTQVKPLLSAAEDAGKGKAIRPEAVNTLRKIVSHFDPIDAGKDVRQIAHQLKRFIEDSGVFYEKKIEKAVKHLLQDNRSADLRGSMDIPAAQRIANKDLKAHLLLLRQSLATKEAFLKSTGAEETKTLKKTVEKFLSEITSRQGDTRAKAMRSDPFQVCTYLIPIKELDEEARIKAYYRKKNKPDSKEGFKLSLLLTMENIGPLRTDLFLQNKCLAIDFFVSESVIEGHLQDHLEDLKDALAGFFDHVSIQVFVSEKEISQFEFEDLVPLGTGLIDLRV